MYLFVAVVVLRLWSETRVQDTSMSQGRWLWSILVCDARPWVPPRGVYLYIWISKLIILHNREGTLYKCSRLRNSRRNIFNLARLPHNISIFIAEENSF